MPKILRMNFISSCSHGVKDISMTDAHVTCAMSQNWSYKKNPMPCDQQVHYCQSKVADSSNEAIFLMSFLICCPLCKNTFEEVVTCFGYHFGHVQNI